MDVKYYLKDAESKTKTMILLSYSYKANGKSHRLRCSTKQSVDPKHWNQNKQLVKSSSASCTVVNAQLRKINTLLPDILYSITREDGHPSPAHLKEKLFKELDGEKDTVWTFFAYAEDYYERSVALKKSKERCKKIKSGINCLRAFEKYWGKRIDFDTIDMVFYDAFKNYEINHLGNNLNTFGTKVAILKAILNDATARRVNKYSYYKATGFTATTFKPDNIYLTREEIKKIADLKIKDGLKDSVRDLFLVATETGLRFGDYSRLTSDYIDKKSQTISITTAKTKSKIVLPISKILKRVLEKYDYQLPKSPPNQVSNRYLKDIGKKAGINEIVTLNKNIAGEETEVKSPKYQNIATHTGRRSFATNLYMKGVPSAFIMKFTGHKDEKTFFNYIKVDLKKMAEKLAEVVNAEDY